LTNREAHLPSTFLTHLSYEDEVLNVFINGTLERRRETDGKNSVIESRAVSLGALPEKMKNSNVNFHKGPIYEVLVFDRKLSKEERLYLEGYLIHKWDLIDEVQTHHPYKLKSPLQTDISTPNGDVKVDLTNTIYQKEITGLDFGAYAVSDSENSFNFELFDPTFSTQRIDNSSSSVAIHPNPVVKSFTITNNSNKVAGLYHPSGKLISTLQVNNGVFELPSSVSSGVYYVVLFDHNKEKTVLKLVKE